MNAANVTDVDLDQCEVLTLRATDPHRLVLRFRDGLVAELDFANVIADAPGPLAAALREPAYFASATLDDGVLTWSNGFDIDPVTLRRWAERGFCE